jgi:hypothetical protein
MKLFVAEIEFLSPVTHQHVVDFVGSYTDSRYIGLIILPVDEIDLSVFLPKSTPRSVPSYEHFNCLATALKHSA